MTTKIVCLVSSDQNQIDAFISSCQSLDLEQYSFSSLDETLVFTTNHPYDAIIIDSTAQTNGSNISMWALEHVNFHARFLILKHALNLPELKDFLKKEILDSSPLEALKAEYTRSIPQKISRLETDLANLRENINEENLKALRFDVHKLAGNSGTYGFVNCSAICKEFEKDLMLKLEQINSSMDKSVWLNDFQEQIKKISSSLL